MGFDKGSLMVSEYSFPTLILLGQGAIESWAERIDFSEEPHFLIVTDKTVLELGLCERLTSVLDRYPCEYSLFSEVHPNPLEADVEQGLAAFRYAKASAIIALGGGAAIDVAKAIKLALSYPGGLKQFQLDTAPWANSLQLDVPCYALPTTAGTGSEVGRSAVIVLAKEKDKSILFHPQILPEVAVLEPRLTQGLPPAITVATGIDALTHCLEAYLAPAFHPLCDGIALQGIELVVAFLPRAYAEGGDLEAREKMQLAASMGAIAFQKGLGMAHAMAHPLSAYFNVHHGLANALVLSECIQFMERQPLTDAQIKKLQTLNGFFCRQENCTAPLSENLAHFIASLGIVSGLEAQGVEAAALPKLAEAAFRDPCAETNMIAVSQDQFLACYQEAF